MIKIDCEQLSPEWFLEKVGKPSAGSFDKIVTSKGEPSKQREKYLYQLAGETIAGMKTETYSNEAMKRGIELEAEARDLFMMITDLEVTQVGIIYPDAGKAYGCSPDGIIEDSAGLEIKCPLIHTHVDYLLRGILPTDYVQQVQGSMLVTGFNWWFFCSYFPGLPPLIIKVPRDGVFIEKLRTELEKFCLDLAIVINKLKAMI
ncbi:MAG: YqaJ viral recombinase family protein [Syntrophales bacterium]|nr:YqaJ viral recombinase family protein [Syntrophales bacterium]